MIRYLFFLSQKMFGTVKKVFLVIFVFGLIIGLFSHFIQKDKPQVQYDVVKESRKDIYTKLNDPELNKSLPTRLSLKTFRVMACAMAGEACTDNPDDGDKNFPNSLFGKASQIMALPYTNPPASGTYWAINTFQNAGLVPKTYAAEGIGFASIKPLMNLWKVFRDVTYMLLVLFLVAIGFMIMFRVKINPQTVISVENSLPKIAVSMILITFSFAIAGFLIDLMYILIALIISILSNNGTYYPADTMLNELIAAGPGKLFQSLLGQPLGFINSTYKELGGGFRLPMVFLFGNQLRQFLGPLVSGLLNVIVTVIMALWVAPQIDKAGWPTKILEATENITIVAGVGKLISKLLSLPLHLFYVTTGMILGPVIVTALLGIGFFITLVFLWFRVFFLLLNSYIQIVLLVIFSPFLIVLELIPGSKSGFSQWFKNLLGELAVFVVVITMILISNVLQFIILETMSNTTRTVVGSNIGIVFAPPFLGGIDPTGLAIMISTGLMLVLPDIVKTVKEALGAKGMGINMGMGTYFGGIGTLGTGAFSALGTFSTMKLAAPGIIKRGIKAVGGSKGGMIEKLFFDQTGGQDTTTNTPASGPQHG